MTLIDYLYVDENRLDSYIEQFSSSIKYDKIAAWKVSLGLKGPALERGRTSHSRQATIHEKIKMLIKHMEKEKIVAFHRPTDAEKDTEPSMETSFRTFRLETCEAVRIHIRPRISQRLQGAALWVSEAAPGIENEQTDTDGYYHPTGTLYLLENPPGQDEEFTERFSSYSALRILLESASEEARKALLGPNPPEHMLNLGTEVPTRLSDLLALVEADVGAPRAIRTLYRVRASVNDSASTPTYAVATVGYPVFIAADL